MNELTVHTWCNGNLRLSIEAGPSIGSISLHIGTGVFDGIMAYWNVDHYYLHRVEEHLERLRRGAAAMGMHLRWTTEELRDAIRLLLEHEIPRDYYIRPIALRGGPELTITGADSLPPDLCIFGVPVARDSDVALGCCIAAVQRVSSCAMPVCHKVSGVYVNSYLARREAQSRGFQDGILLDSSGRITEASAANIFLIASDTLITPELTPEILAGITRRVVLELAADFGIPCAERPVWPAELSGFEGAFLCSTLMEIRAVERIDEISYATASNRIFQRIRDQFRRVTHQ